MKPHNTFTLAGFGLSVLALASAVFGLSLFAAGFAIVGFLCLVLAGLCT